MFEREPIGRIARAVGIGSWPRAVFDMPFHWAGYIHASSQFSTNTPGILSKCLTFPVTTVRPPALYTVRSERAFCEQLDYNLLFRWFLDMNLIEPSFDATTFTKNRERLLRHGGALFGEVVLEADRQGLLSDEHFTVDGTLIEAAASLKSFNLVFPTG